MLNAGWVLVLRRRLNNRPPPSLVMNPGRDWLSIKAGMIILERRFFVSSIHVWYMLYSKLPRSCLTTLTSRS